MPTVNRKTALLSGLLFLFVIVGISIFVGIKIGENNTEKPVNTSKTQSIASKALPTQSPTAITKDITNNVNKELRLSGKILESGTDYYVMGSEKGTPEEPTGAIRLDPANTGIKFITYAYASANPDSKLDQASSKKGPYTVTGVLKQAADGKPYLIVETIE